MNINRFKIDGQTASLQTRQGVILLDAEDLHLLGNGIEIKMKSQSNGTYIDVYTGKRPRKRIGALSRLVMNPESNMVVDHINHDTLDNRKSNLRICTRAQNSRNNVGRANRTTPYKGVSFMATGVNATNYQSRPWRAYTRVMGKRVWLGYHATAEQAAQAYNEYAAQNFGEYALLNAIPARP